MELSGQRFASLDGADDGGGKTGTGENHPALKRAVWLTNHLFRRQHGSFFGPAL